MQQPKLKSLTPIILVAILFNWSCATTPKYGEVTPKKAEGEMLEQMNNVFIPRYMDTCNNGIGEELKLLIIGNSLSFHGIAPGIGWNHNGGMAASKKEKDFAHLLFQSIEERLPDQKVCMRISNFAKFEREPKSWNAQTVKELQDYGPDIVVFQLGENVDGGNASLLKLFGNQYIKLIDSFKSDGQRHVVATTPFFPSLEKNKIIQQAVRTTGIHLVDLSHLTLIDPENYAKNETDYAGEKNDWKVDGIGIHPGDKGMQNIANLLFISIQSFLDSKY
nr:SGNH/GDSL hydrolase family protein [uncultured Allomuricauda sp.]